MNDKLRIVIVEDEAIIAENLKFSLEDLGYEVTATCYNYNEAINTINQHDFDLALLDINLGDKVESNNGLSLAEMIGDTAPFIFITAYNDKETITLASKLRPYGYLIKPVNNAMLFATIQTAIERYDKKEVADQADNEQEKPGYFFVKIGTRTMKADWSEVYCLEAGKNYVKIRSKANHMDYPIRGSLSYVIDNLMPATLHDDFIRINRSVYLNRKYITAYDGQYVYCNEEKFEAVKNWEKQFKDFIVR